METDVERLLEGVALAACISQQSLFDAVDRIPAPLYVTDDDGFVLHANPWCYRFAGRQPQGGKDRWCVTWKLYDMEGNFMPHDTCPMAGAIRERRPNRGLVAKAKRPDGSWVTFMPFPTPVFTANGELAGAVNMLVDITEPAQAEDLRQQAVRCSRLSDQIGDQQASEALALMSVQYTIKAHAMDLRIGTHGLKRTASCTARF
jgi:PAS domain-containing protein